MERHSGHGVEVLDACERAGIAFIPCYPLARGGLQEVSALTRPAERLGVSSSAVALGWLLRRSAVIIPIPGTRTPSHLRDNLTALDVAGRLTGDEIAALTAVEDEAAAQLSAMSPAMLEAFRRSLATG